MVGLLRTGVLELQGETTRNGIHASVDRPTFPVVGRGAERCQERRVSVGDKAFPLRRVFQQVEGVDTHRRLSEVPEPLNRNKVDVSNL